ncbi:MAG: tyrosine-type recombinase/integrase [Myxococcales bacterium]
MNEPVLGRSRSVRQNRKVTFHSLRHLFAVRLLTRGMPVTAVSEFVGHSNINLAVKHYGWFSSDAKVKWQAVKVLDVA